MLETDRQARFVAMMTDCQRRLYAYILTLAPNAAEADDLLQQTNLVMWEKASEFDPDAPGSSFNAWACRIAQLQAMAHFKRTKRRSWLSFHDGLMDKLAATAAERVDRFDERRVALRRCLAKLPAQDRELIRIRYEGRGAVADVAGQVGRSSGAIKQALYRIRGTLLACIEQATAEGGDR